MKIHVTLETTLTVEFDEESPEFKELFEQYTTSIENIDHEGFAENVCNHVARYGANDFIEGVGLVRVNGEKQVDYIMYDEPREVDCPVNVKGDFDLNSKCDFEITNVEIYNI